MASAYSVRPLPDARVSTPLSWDEVPTVEAEAFTIDTVPARYAAIGDPGAGIDDAVGLARGAARAVAPARGGGPGRRAVAAELREAGRRAAAGPAVEGAPGAGRVRAGPRRGRWPAAGGRGGAGGGGRGRRPERRPADRVGRVAPDADRPRKSVDPGHRDLARRARRPRRSRASSAGRRAIRRSPRALEPADVLVDGDARPLVALVPRPGQPHPRARRRTGRRRSRSRSTTTRGPATSGRTAPDSSSGRRAGRTRGDAGDAAGAGRPARRRVTRDEFVEVLERLGAASAAGRRAPRSPRPSRTDVVYGDPTRYRFDAARSDLLPFFEPPPRRPPRRAGIA